MKSTRILLSMVVAAVISCGSIAAQDTKSANSRKDLNPEELMEKRIQRLQNKLELDEATAAKFTPLYKEYMKEMRACHPRRGEFKRGANVKDSESDKDIEKRLECRQKMLDTQKKYYKEFKGILNPSQMEILFNQSKNFHKNGRSAQLRHRHDSSKCGKSTGHAHHNHQQHCDR